MGSGTRTFARYMLPLTPIAALFAARTVMAIAARLPARARGAATLLLTIAVAALSAGRVVATDRLLAARDTRLLASDFVDSAVAADERVLWIGRYAAPPHRANDARIDVRDAAAIRSLLPLDGDLDAALAKAGYRYVVTADHWLMSPFDAPPELTSRLRDSLREVATFGPLEAGRERRDVAPCFDEHDFFYLPFAEQDGFARPGPFLHVFRRGD